MCTPTVSIITVGMNHLPYMKNLLHSLYIESTPCVSFEMIYVDNCSTDNTVDFIHEFYPDVKIIKNNVPLGFGENNNKGVFASIGKYIAIINPDIVLQKNCIDILHKYLDAHPNIGIVVPKLLNPDWSIQYSIRGYISVEVFFRRLLSRGNDSFSHKSVECYLCKNIDINRIQTIDWAIGAALFMQRDVYSKLGGFDLDYFLYMEDEDICLRSWKCNLPVVYIPQSIMIHNHLRGSSKLGKKTFLHLKSIFTFFRKHGIHIKSYKSSIDL